MEGESFPIIRECTDQLVDSFGHSASSRGLFGRALEEIEGLGGFGCDGVWGLFELVGDFEDARGIGGKRGDLFGDVVPVDGAAAGPEVIVVLTLVVVEVELGDAGLEELEGFVDADVVFGRERWAWPMSRQTPTRSK